MVPLVKFTALGSGVQAHQAGPIWPYSETLLPYIFEKNLMNSYHVHEASYLKCEIDCPWVRSSGPKQGQYGHKVKCIKSFKIFLITIYIWEKRKAWSWSPHKNCEIDGPWVRCKGHRERHPKWPFSENV